MSATVLSVEVQVLELLNDWPVYLTTDTSLDTSAENFRLRFPETTMSTKTTRRPSPSLDECPPPRPNSIVKLRQRFEALYREELAKLVKLNHYEVLNKKYMTLDPVEDGFEPIPDRSLRGDPPSQRELIQSMASFLTADWETFRFLDLLDLWRSQLGARWWNNDARFSFWGKRFEEPVKYRPVRIKGASRTDRATLDDRLEALEARGIWAPEVLDEYYRPFVLQWAPDATWQLLDKPLKSILKFNEKHRFQRWSSHGKFSGATATGAVAHGDFYQRALDARKILDGELERHRGECGHDGECDPPTQDLIKSNIAVIEAQVQAAKESMLAERAAYEYLPRREWVDGQCEFRLIKPWTKPGHCEVYRDKPPYVSSHPNWIKLHSDVSKVEHLKPNAAFLLHDGYTGNSKRPAWVKGFGKLGKLKKTSSGEYPFIQVNLEHYKATKEILLEQVDFKKAERPTKAQLQWAKEVTGIPAEPRGEKFIKRKSEDTGDIEEDESYHTGDDEEAAPGYLEGFHITDDGGTKETEPLDHEQLAAARRWRDAKAAAGEFHNLNDPAEFTREQNGIKVNIKNEELRFTAFMMQWLLENPTKDPDKDNVRWLEDTAVALDTSVDALRKRFDRAFKQIKEMEAMKDYEEIPVVPLTPKQEADVANGATLVLVKLNEWNWYKLEIEKHGTFDAALESLKVERQMEAMRKRPEDKAVGKDSLGVWKETNGTYDVQFNTDHPEWIVAFKEVKDRFDKAFHPARIRVKHPTNPKWKGLLSGE